MADLNLTKKMLNGDQSEVPVGVNVITNKTSKNSKNVQRIVTGQPTKTLQVEYFQADGYEDTQVERDPESNEFVYEDPIDPNIKRSVDWSFDDSTGKLTFVRRDKTVVEIPAFLRQIDFGVGPTGPRGDPGRNGRDGGDGEDGKDGVAGCAGSTGEDGRTGEEGNRGEEGPVGATGPAGPRGIRGERGPTGPEGIIGFEGIRGPCGFACPSNLVGPDGPTGPQVSPLVCTGAAPNKDCLIWATPDDCLCPLGPEVDYLDIPEPTVISERILNAPPLVCVGGETVNGVWLGPTSVNGTYTERVWSDGRIERTQPDYGGAICRMPVRPPPVIKCVWESGLTYVYKTRRRKKNDNMPHYYFYKNGILIYHTQIYSKNGGFAFQQGNPITVDGRKYWQGGQTNFYYDSSYHDFYQLCGEFEQDE